MTEADAAHDGRVAVTVIAPPRLPFLLLAALFLLITAYSVALSGLGDPSPIWARLVGFGPLGVITGSFLGLATARSFVRDDTVHVHRVTVTHHVPVNEIVRVDTAIGVALWLTSGRRIWVVRRGTAGIRARKAAEGLQQLLDSRAAEPSPPRDDNSVTTARWSILVFTIVVIATAVWLSGVAASQCPGCG